VTGLTGIDPPIFTDNFVVSSANQPIDSNLWNFNDYAKGGSYYGQTQQRQSLPTASPDGLGGGVMQLKLNSKVPANDPKFESFLGSEAISKRTFDLSQGPLAFEAKLKYAQDQKGIVGGFFLFAGPPDTHDEIDWELFSRSNPQVTTNIYHNEKLGGGHATFKNLPDSQLVEHTYRIEWLPTMVRWLVDGVEFRTETDLARIPTKAMNLHFNIWAPKPDWPFADPSLKTFGASGIDQTWEFDVRAVKVEKVTTLSGTGALDVSSAGVDVSSAGVADNLVGTSASEFIDGGDGDDRLMGRGGDDVLDGGTGTNTVVYEGLARNFAISARADEHTANIRDRFGSEGTDTLYQVQQVQFLDRTIDVTFLVKAASLGAADFIPIIDLYNAYLHRAPDASGLWYWASRFADGATLQGIASSLFASSEAALLRPPGQSIPAIVASAYTDILGRAGDQDGMNYWIGELQSGRLSQDQFGLAFVQAAKGNSADGQVLVNKESIGAHYAIDQGLNDADHARLVLAGSDVLVANAMTDGFAAAAATAATSELVMKLIGVHIDDVFGAA